MLRGAFSHNCSVQNQKNSKLTRVYILFSVVKRIIYTAKFNKLKVMTGMKYN